MRILVYDVAAQDGGAATILEKYYHQLTEDQENEYIFVLSLLRFPEKENARMINLEWVKRSWFHRLFCDHIYMPRLVKKLGTDLVFSLQNMGIPHCKTPQKIYLHNVIPFTNYRFSFGKERFLWVYQNIIGRMICRSLKKAQSVIVQTQWMKDAVAEQCGIDRDRIQVERVESAIIGEGTYAATEPVTFFYPAMPVAFKNHRTIVEACKILKGKGIENYRVWFTFTEHENTITEEVAAAAQENGLPIEMIGKQDHRQMVDRYCQSVLLFPSYLETVGLPLLEVQQFGSPIIAADCAYARETVGTYDKVSFFSATNSGALAECMERWIK